MNRIGPEALPAMAERAWRSYAALFDPPGHAETLDADLRAALDEAAERYDRGDKTKTLQTFLGTVDARRQELASDIWSAWGALAKAELGKPNYGRRDALRAAAAMVLSHPRLHADVAAYLRETYAAAAAMLATFAEWKKAARVVGARPARPGVAGGWPAGGRGRPRGDVGVGRRGRAPGQ